MRDRPDCSYIPIKPEVLANFGRAEAAWHKPPAGVEAAQQGNGRGLPIAPPTSAGRCFRLRSFYFFLYRLRVGFPVPDRNIQSPAFSALFSGSFQCGLA